MTLDKDSVGHKIREAVIGKPRDIKDPSLFHKLALIPVLAWIGLGADGLSSSSYGPEEAFKVLGQHTYLALALAVATALTVFIISYAYSRIIEHFPSGGGGYIVATHTLGEKAGVISGSALLVDYVLTITVSIVACGDAIFSFFPTSYQPLKIPFEIAAIVVPHRPQPPRDQGIGDRARADLHRLRAHPRPADRLRHLQPRPRHRAVGRQRLRRGLPGGTDHARAPAGMLLLFLRAFSMGGGTYTGIEAVSNGLQIMREPRVQNGKRTMVYMSVSLAFTAGGILALLPALERPAGRRQDPQRRARRARSSAAGAFGAVLAAGHDLLRGRACSSSPPRPGSSTGRGSWPTWPSTPGSPTASPRSRTGSRCRTASCSWAARPSCSSSTRAADLDARGHVFDQRLPDLLTLRVGDVAVLHQEQAQGANWKKHLAVHLTGLTLCLTILVVTDVREVPRAAAG